MAEIQIWLENYKKLSDPNLSAQEKSNIKNRLVKIYTKLKPSNLSDEEKIFVTQKMYSISKIMSDEILPEIKNRVEYKLQQMKLRETGRAERNRRTHQLIFIGSVWSDFLKKNNLMGYEDVHIFENILQKISKNVNVAEENIIIGHDDFALPVSPYTGRDKKIIHYYCQIGGTWESFWREICKNDSRDKRIYKILKQTENEKINLEKIKYEDFNFFCNEKRCEKIGAYNNFFKSRCLKLDEKFFYGFLYRHKQDIINTLIH